MRIDARKSLNALCGFGRLNAPPDARELVKHRDEIRNKPIRDLTDEELHRLFQIGCDVQFLIPLAIKRLKRDPEILGLLCSVLSAEYDWRAHPSQVRQLRMIVAHALGGIAEITDDLDR